MKRHLLTTLMYGGSALAVLIAATPASAVKLFNQDDNILAIDLDPRLSQSPSNGNENANKLVDQVVNLGPPPSGTTKYLNFAREGSGFIVTPTFGSSNIQSFQLRAANDSSSRDPLTYTLYGTNDPIESANNSMGEGGEDWTPISSGVTGLATDPGRHGAGEIQDIANGAMYSSYKMIFDTIRDKNAGDADSMQVADVQFYTEPGGLGSAVLSTADGPHTLAIAEGTDSLSWSRIPGANEAPSKAFDGDNGSKYLNFAGVNSGAIVSRADGKPTIVESLQLVTGGDAPGRDPLTFALYGTDDPLLSYEHSRGNLEDWVLVASGDTGIAHLNLGTPEHRNQPGDIILVDNATAFSAYRVVFTSLRGGPTEGLMQVSEIILSGQVVPEPSTFVLVGMAVTAFGLVARRRNTRSA